VDRSTIARWVLIYAPILNERIRSEMNYQIQRADSIRNELPDRPGQLDVSGSWTFQSERSVQLTVAGDAR